MRGFMALASLHLAASVVARQEFQQCWEGCFQQLSEADEAYKPAYAELYDMGMEATRLKNIKSVNGTVLLLDSTLSNWHDSSLNPNLPADETADSIWQFQLNLASIVSIMMQSDFNKNSLTVTQFNELSGWGCDSHAALTACEAFTLLQNADANLQPIQLNATSHLDGNIEPACRLAFHSLQNPFLDSGEATPVNEREMAIAIVNSNVHTHIDRSDEWDDYSPCNEHFNTRYAIGTHSAEYHRLKRWSSEDAHATYIKDNAYTMAAAQNMVECMSLRCCNGAVTIDAPTTCEITTDHFGENIIDFTTHVAYPQVSKK